MPLPFLAIGLGIATSAATLAIAHKVGKSEGYREGRDTAEESAAAQINEYKQKLQELQKEREQTKKGFKTVMDNISTIDITDEGFFSKIATFFKGYTNFHIYVVTCIAYTRYQILKVKMPKKDSEELKMLVLGLVSSGFPDNLKNDINAVWDSSDLDPVMTEYHKYRAKLNKKTLMSLDEIIYNINEYVKQFAKLSKETREFEKRIKTA